MRIIAYLAMPSALLCVAPSAQADWQYTKWGMTPDQVIAAAPPESGLRWVAKSATNGPYLKGHYGAGEYRFESRFWFSDKGLYEVELELDTRTAYCIKLKASMLVTYPDIEPNRKAALHGHFLQTYDNAIEWIDHAKSNVVYMNEDLSSCSLVYHPMPPKIEKEDGL
ncbi:hypothetical protein [Rhizobium sp. R693]|uniref:hypothetical protein n=1 Tax=Rhizobium sp. R693 TaxID=1764276 RepID=UPI0011315AF4|nr:hypothetical protein [Rhizobium sp. R693]